VRGEHGEPRRQGELPAGRVIERRRHVHPEIEHAPPALGLRDAVQRVDLGQHLRERAPPRHTT